MGLVKIVEEEIGSLGQKINSGYGTEGYQFTYSLQGVSFSQLKRCIDRVKKEESIDLHEMTVLPNSPDNLFVIITFAVEPGQIEE
ncbi:MAG: hypothetical protein JSW61_09980 [Candidatus Thorarchaeota archaeon]|nr:MAG: hypothetical protein JSW61_09980 [Candidatus Thorarchaeota archaeon]